jgi:hypothetical protein
MVTNVLMSRGKSLGAEIGGDRQETIIEQRRRSLASDTALRLDGVCRGLNPPNVEELQ